MNNDRWLNLDQASEYSGKSKRVLRKDIKEGRLFGTKSGRGIFTKKGAIDAYLQGLPQEVTALKATPVDAKLAKELAQATKELELTTILWNIEDKKAKTAELKGKLLKQGEFDKSLAEQQEGIEARVADIETKLTDLEAQVAKLDLFDHSPMGVEDEEK